jgi:hypothetical protein
MHRKQRRGKRDRKLCLKTDAKYRIIKAIHATIIQTSEEHAPIAGIPFLKDTAILGAAGVERAIIGPISAGLHTTEE